MWTSEPAGADARLALLVATRKGAWLYRTNERRQRWHVEGPHFVGSIVHHFVLDPRDGRTMLVAASTGHLGPTVFRSTDAGATWSEARQPPAFRKAPEGEKFRSYVAGNSEQTVAAGGEAFRAMYLAEYRDFGKVVDALGLRK